MRKTRVSLILSCVLMLSGCAGSLERDVTQEEPYRQFIGQSFELKKGLYLIGSVSGRTGFQIAAAGDSFWQTPASLTEQFIGQRVYHDAYRIIDVLPAGSILRIQKAERSIHTEDIFYLVWIELPNGKVYEKVGTAGFIDGNAFPPVIREPDFLLKR